MYIKSSFKYESKLKSEKDYKALLKNLTTLDIRKISKFNLLAMYGSLSSLESKNYKKNLDLYIASNFACIQETYKVLQNLKEQNIVMPFDFLNINTNNMGFYICKALNVTGNSYTITSKFLSFEKALHTIFLEYQNGINSSFLLGYVDNSLESINFKEQTNNQELYSNDISSFIYLDSNKEDSLAKLEYINYFRTIDDLNRFLSSQDYDAISLNYYAKLFKDNIAINSLFLKEYSNFASAINMINLLNDSYKKALFVSLDDNKRAYVVSFSKE